MAKYLVIGAAGSMGRRHCANLAALRPAAEIVRADPALEDAPGQWRDWASVYGGRLSALSGVVIASPHGAHVEQMRACAQAGLPFFVEKPLGPGGSWGECDAVARQMTGKPCAVGFQYRYHPAVRAVADNWRAGGLAEFVAADNLPQYGPTVAETMTSHALDLALWTLGPAADVDLTSDGRKLAGRVKHVGGAVSTYAYDMTKGQRVSVVYGRASATWLTPHEPAYRDELADWLAWVETGYKSDYLATLADGLAVQAVLEQVKHE